GGCPVRELRQPAQLLRELHRLLERALEALLPHRHVEPGLAQRVRERAEGVPVEGLRGQSAPSLVDIACGRYAAQLLAELLQEGEELLARREPSRHEAGRPL